MSKKQDDFIPGEITQETAVYVRERLHRVAGLMRENLWVSAFELVNSLSERMDSEYYHEVKP